MSVCWFCCEHAALSAAVGALAEVVTYGKRDHQLKTNESYSMYYPRSENADRKYISLIAPYYTRVAAAYARQAKKATPLVLALVAGVFFNVLFEANVHFLATSRQFSLNVGQLFLENGTPESTQATKLVRVTGGHNKCTSNAIANNDWDQVFENYCADRQWSAEHQSQGQHKQVGNGMLQSCCRYQQRKQTDRKVSV
jgi:hypothetical protein